MATLSYDEEVEAMDHMDEKKRGHGCGCGGLSGGKREPASETQPHGGDGTVRSPLDILDERFARGEIDKAEYQEKKQLISQRATPKPDTPNCDQSELGSTEQDARR